MKKNPLKKKELIKRIAKLESFIKKQTITEHRQIKENGDLKRAFKEEKNELGKAFRGVEMILEIREEEIERYDKILDLLNNNK